LVFFPDTAYESLTPYTGSDLRMTM